MALYCLQEGGTPVITREEAVELIEDQMLMRSPKTKTLNKSAFHYGRVELRELLDAIYGEWKEGDPEL